MSFINQILLQIKNNYSDGGPINFNLFDFSTQETDSYINATTTNAYEYFTENDFPRGVDDSTFFLEYRLKGSYGPYSKITLPYLDLPSVGDTSFFSLGIPLKQYFDTHPEIGIYLGTVDYGQEQGNFSIVSEIYEFGNLRDLSD